MAVLGQYLDARGRAGAPAQPESPFFRNEMKNNGYALVTLEHLLTDVIRRAGLKPATGRIGPRVHDLRHAFVVHRMTTWYQEGINPQSRLHYLATYLGHKDIYSTLVYLTITQDLLQQASERFRSFGAGALDLGKGGEICS